MAAGNQALLKLLQNEAMQRAQVRIGLEELRREREQELKNMEEISTGLRRLNDTLMSIGSRLTDDDGRLESSPKDIERPSPTHIDDVATYKPEDVTRETDRLSDESRTTVGTSAAQQEVTVEYRSVSSNVSATTVTLPETTAARRELPQSVVQQKTTKVSGGRRRSTTTSGGTNLFFMLYRC